jgi:hypothetical protein
MTSSNLAQGAFPMAVVLLVSTASSSQRRLIAAALAFSTVLVALGDPYTERTAPR